MDPLLRLSADWLARNVPDYDGPVVLVQGDTGPGNFMYADGKVTAVVDWELAHWGDPMDDIAWLSLRTVQDTFTYLPDRLAEYAALSGVAIDEARVWYYRLFAESTMTTLYPNEGVGTTRPGEQDDDNVTRDIGNGIIYRQLHRRLWLEALGQVMGLELDPPSLPAPTEMSEWHHFYPTVLGSLATIVPRIADPLASQWTKGVARVVKYLQELDARGTSSTRSWNGTRSPSCWGADRSASPKVGPNWRRRPGPVASATRTTSSTCGTRCSETTTSCAPPPARYTSEPGPRSSDRRRRAGPLRGGATSRRARPRAADKYSRVSSAQILIVLCVGFGDSGRGRGPASGRDPCAGGAGRGRADNRVLAVRP